jgi:radical SAM superfamily enzyme YgiQ (UPF0313 family)
MRTLLINPPVEDFYITGIRRQPLGLLYIASSLIQAGYKPELLNCHTGKKQVLDLPAELNYLKEYIDHPDPEYRFPFKNYTHYGMSWQEIESRIKKTPADIYLISSLFSTYFQETERIISIIRKYNSQGVIAVGGYHPSLHTEYFINKTGTDYVIKGEGEVAAVQFVRAIEKGGAPEDIPGIISRRSSYEKRKLMALPPDINKISFPSRELLLQRDFRVYRKNFVSMISSRGCPNRCSFCTGKTIWGNRYRGRVIDDVIREIIHCSDKYNADIINFEDDNLFPSVKRAHELLTGIIGMKNSMKISCEFTAMNGISIESIGEEIIPLMKDAGFNELNISLVTQSAEVQRLNRRPFDSDKFRSIAECAKKCGLNVRGYFILGMPGQDRNEIEDTISFMQGLGIQVFPSVFYNVFSPASEWKMQRSSAFFNETPELPRRELIRFFYKCSRKH